MPLPDSRRNFFRSLASASLLLAGGAGCTRQSAGDDPNHLRMGVSEVSPRLDPRFATDAFSGRVLRLLMPALVDFDDSSRPIPWLALDWQWLDGLRLQVRLRPANFHHGKPVTAADVVASYASVLDPATASPLRGPLRSLSQVSVMDEQRVLFTWKEPDPLAPSRLTLPILPADLLEQGHDFERTPIGSGPCQFVARADQSLVLRRADGMTLGFYGVKDASVRLLKLVRNELDLIQNDLAPELVAHARSRAQLQVESRDGSTFAYLGMNLRHDALAQPSVRLAIAHAIDRQLIARTLMDGLAHPSGGIFSAEHWCGLSADESGPAYDPPLARQLLAQAGIELPLRLTFKTSSDATRLRLASVYQQMLAQVGIELEILSYDWGTFYSDIKQGRFEMYSLAWVGVKSPEIFDYAFASHSFPPQGANRGYYVDSELDGLLLQARQLPLTQMGSGYQMVQRHLLKTLPIIPLWHEQQVLIRRRSVEGYRLYADGRYDGLLQVRRT